MVLVLRDSGIIVNQASRSPESLNQWALSFMPRPLVFSGNVGKFDIDPARLQARRALQAKPLMNPKLLVIVMLPVKKLLELSIAKKLATKVFLTDS